MALVSDAGAPAVSDPGSVVVQAVLAAGLRVIPLPGPSAVITALILLAKGPALLGVEAIQTAGSGRSKNLVDQIRGSVRGGARARRSPGSGNRRESRSQPAQSHTGPLNFALRRQWAFGHPGGAFAPDQAGRWSLSRADRWAWPTQYVHRATPSRGR